MDRAIRYCLAKRAGERYQSARDLGFDLKATLSDAGEKDQAFEWFEKAFRAKSEELLFLKVDPKLDSLRSDAGYADLLRRMNLAP